LNNSKEQNLTTKKKKTIEVVAAIIIYEGNILCTQRGKSKYDYISEKFEFPGGKIEKGETHKEAIKREILEELDMEISIDSHYLTVNHEYPNFELIMHSYVCFANTLTLKLLEHISYVWLPKSELRKLDWAAADKPIVAKLETNG